MAASFDMAVMRQISEVIGVESRALSQREYKTSFDARSGNHGVSLNYLVCKDAAEVNMNRHPLWGRNPETYVAWLLHPLMFLVNSRGYATGVVVDIASTPTVGAQTKSQQYPSPAFSFFPDGCAAFHNEHITLKETALR